MKYKLITRYFAIKIFAILFKILEFSPINKTKKYVPKIEKWRNKISPNLYDQKDFLLYVKKKSEGFNLKCQSIETLVFRGSNSDYGFYPALWENSYNLGLTSTDFFSSYHLYINYQDELEKLKNIILFTQVSSIGYSLNNTIERYRSVSYKYFFNIPYMDDSKINQSYEKWIFNKCRNLKPTKIESNYFGYDTKSEYTINMSVKDRAQTHLRENQRIPDQLCWLEKLADTISTKQRRFFVIIPPCRNDYKALLPPSTELFKKLYKIKGIKILNFHDSDEFYWDDFGDTDHLNEKGAIKLTKQLYELINRK